MRKLALALAALLWLSPSAAFAVPVTWTLTGVTFDDGGTASGSFVYDADTNTYSGVNITTTAGATRGGDVYPGPIFSVLHSAGFLGPLAGPEVAGTPILQLFPTTPFTNSGGVLTVNVGSSESDCTAACLSFQPPLRRVTAGTFVGAPPPSIPTMTEWGMILMGLVLAGGAAVMIQRRRAFA